MVNRGREGLSRRAAARLLRVCAAVACAFVSASAQQGPQSALAPAGTQARDIGGLWWLFFYVLSAVWLLVMAAAALAVYYGWRNKREAEPRAVEGEPPLPDASPDPASERRKSLWVGGAVGVTAVILFVFLVSSFLTGRAVSSMSTGDSVYIEVTGHQWWWEVHYIDPVSSNNITTANEIHIPVGRPVQIKLHSADVIHSFWVPNLAGKRDLIPGKDATLMLKADREGTYRGQCAEFCGHQHAHMAFLVVAESPDKFRAWQQQQRQPSAQPADDLQRRGQAVFLSSPCVMCHTITGTQAGSKVGPDLTHVGSRATIAAATLPNTPGNVGGWVSDAQGVKPGCQMPPNNLSPDDLQAVIAYLQSLK
jgi:cytochrome c oxidase subunit II